MPGESFVYRFVADQVGTYWYHSHQVSHEQVRRGLLGASSWRRRPTPDDRSPCSTSTTPSRTLNGEDRRTTVDAPSRARRCGCAS